MTRLKVCLARAILPVLLLAFPSAHAAGPADPAAVLAPMVSVVTAIERELVAHELVTGTLEARQEVLVGPKIDGSRIAGLLADEGDMVVQGQVLARLSRELWDAQLASAEAALARAKIGVAVADSQVDEAAAAALQAQADFERARALIQRGNTSAATLDEREAAAKSAKARVATARQGVRLAEAQVAEAKARRDELSVRIAMTEIPAPVAGRISERQARLGALAAMGGEPLFRIIRDDQIELHADVAEVTLAKLAPGQKVEVTPVGRDAPIPGEIRLISPRIDPQTRLGKAEIRLDHAGGLTLGAFAHGRVETAREIGVVVPVTAVQFGEDREEVQLVQDGRVETRIVEIGLRTNELAVIRQGLQAGDRIVAVSGTFLRDGDLVRPVEAGASSKPLADTPQASAKS